MIAFSPDYFIHVANVLLLVAYSVRDILWLRLFAVGASVISIPYFLLQPTVLRAPLVWTVVFAGINLLQSWRLFVERRPVQLSPEEASSPRALLRNGAGRGSSTRRVHHPVPRLRLRQDDAAVSERGHRYPLLDGRLAR
jgi:hypothetical protein